MSDELDLRVLRAEVAHGIDALDLPICGSIDADQDRRTARRGSDLLPYKFRQGGPARSGEGHAHDQRDERSLVHRRNLASAYDGREAVANFAPAFVNAANGGRSSAAGSLGSSPGRGAEIFRGLRRDA